MALKEVLQRNGLTQESVARSVDVSLMTVWNWANGRTVPAGENLVKLADYLRQFEPGITEADLLPVAEAEGTVEGAA